MNAIQRAFALIELAENAIEDRVRQLLENGREHEAQATWNAFKCLQPGPQFRSAAPAVYEFHVGELLDRAAAGEDLRPATKAEVMIAISYMTQQSRLQRDVESLGLALTSECFPEKAGDLLGAYGVDEDYAGSVEEVLAEFRRKLAVEERALPIPLKEIPLRYVAKL